LEQDKLLASDGAAYEYFGTSVSIDGDYAIIGASSNDDENGAAYVFTRSGTDWTQQAKLLASDGAAGDMFGFSVSIDGDYAIIGASDDDDNGAGSGSAYVFTRSGTAWTEQAKLLASDGHYGEYFGNSVSIDGDYAIVGGYYGYDDNGVAYVFIRSGTDWTEQAKLLASDGAADDMFGYSVSIDGDYAIIGARWDDDNGVDSGSAYVFIRSGTAWTEQAKLLASDGDQGEYFGGSVSIDGDYAIIGARWDDDNGVWSGSAYVFIRSGTAWAEQAKLLASDGAADEWFGCSVSIDGDYAIIGARWDDDNGGTSGSAYVFTRSGTAWAEQAKLLASDGAAGDIFGCSVSIDGDYAIVGARGDDDNGVWSGSAYAFTNNISDFNNSIEVEDQSNPTFHEDLAWPLNEVVDYAQGFIPAFSPLTKIRLGIGERGIPPENAIFTVSIRDDLDGDDITSNTIFLDDIDVDIVDIVFPDTDLIIGEMYYIVTSFDTLSDWGMNCYVWGGTVGDSYENGDAWLCYNAEGYYWEKLEPGYFVDWVFTTYWRDYAPDACEIDGPTEGKANENTDYTFCTNDPEGHDVEYLIDWGDGFDFNWYGPYESGENVTKGHSWASKGDYTIRAKARDIYGAEADWTHLEVSIPKTKATNTPFLQFLENHPHLFPLLRQLLGLQ